MRFVYCALVICSVFQAFDQIDVSKAVAYLLSCRVCADDTASFSCILPSSIF